MSSPHRARKRFGQNFLHDSFIIDQILHSIQPTEDDHVIEIGPGQGAITERLLDSQCNLDVVELDRDLVELLSRKFAYHQLKIHSADALKFDFCSLSNGDKLKIVGNLPYNISTPLIFHILDKRHCIESMHFMLQKEVVERLAASPNSKAYGKLSIVTQCLCEVTREFEIPPEAFDPQPKVMSAFVKLVPRENSLVNAGQWQSFVSLVTAAFSQRRKTLRNNLKNLIDIDAAEKVIDLGRRAETLTIDEFIGLLESID